MNSEQRKHKAVCAVAVCSLPKYPGVIYHRFPQSAELRQKWIMACKRDDRLVNPNTASVCSIHFLPTDYKRDLKNELLGLQLQKRLMPDAVPTQKIRIHSPQQSSATTSDARKQRLLRREQKVIVQSLLSSHQSPANSLLVVSSYIQFKPQIHFYHRVKFYVNFSKNNA